jgi:hypothetical protein
MSGDSPNPHTTLCRSNDRYVTASISLGELVYIRCYASWQQEHLVAVRFKHGSMDWNESALREFVAAATRALESATR